MSDVVGELEAITRDERWDDLAAVVDDRFFAYLLQDPEALRRALEAVPERWLRAHPRYLLARSLVRGARQPLGLVDDRELALFREWVQSQPNPATRDRLGLLTAALRHLVTAGRVEDASDTASRIFATIDDATDSAGFHDVLAPVLLRAGTAKLLAGDVSTAIASYAEAKRWAQMRPGHPFERVAARHLALGYAVAGNYAKADRELQRDASAEVDERFGHEAAAYVRGLIAIGRLNRRDAEIRVSEASGVDATSELSWMRVHLRARHALYWGDRDLMVHEVEDYLLTDRGQTRPGSMAGDQLRADLSDLYQALGNLPAAEHVLETRGMSSAHRSVLTSRSRLHLLKGERERALAHLAEAKQLTGGRVHFLASWRVLQVSAGQFMGDPVDVESLRALASSMEHTHAFDALVEGTPEVRDGVARHLRFNPASLPDVYAAPPPRATLTPRESEVLGALREHTSIKAVAAALHVSPNTAKTHLRALYRKLGASGREQALRIASSRFE
ncbi:response regulator transcription factor [Microbacterium sp. CPCC 204701]|uniref:response regulator transcription factor n=1 Tax=Microbacterium sp. CPCC 204701 TaxID=2493084 RepID=UPI000FD82DDE|nr:helix-turn-helix transcriptional regulator [Microbacterium sp. CPCC 204701]